MVITNWEQDPGLEAGAPKRGRGMAEKEVRQPQSQVRQHHIWPRAALLSVLHNPTDFRFSSFFFFYSSPRHVTGTECPKMANVPPGDVATCWDYPPWAIPLSNVSGGGFWFICVAGSPRATLLFRERVLASGSFWHVRLKKWIWAKSSVSSFWLFMRSWYFLLTKTTGNFKTWKLSSCSGGKIEVAKYFSTSLSNLPSIFFPRSNYKQKCHLPFGIFLLKSMKLFQEKSTQRVSITKHSYRKMKSVLTSLLWLVNEWVNEWINCLALHK